MNKFVISVFALGALQGCATTLRLDPIPSDGQTEIYQRGAEALISNKSSIVAVRPASNSFKSTKKPSVVISVTNGTNESHNFGTENITVYLDGKNVKVFAYDELVAEIKRRQAWAAIGAALQGAGESMNAANAGYSYHSGTYDSSSYGSGYTGYGYGSYSGYTYDPAAAQQAQAAADARTQARMAEIKAQTDAALNQLESTALRKETVFPQNTYGGYIVLEKLNVPEVASDLILSVSFGGEIHRFRLRLTQVTN